MYFRKHGMIKGCLEAFGTEEGCKVHLTQTKVLIPIKSSAMSVTAPSAFNGHCDISGPLLFLYLRTVKEKLPIPKLFSVELCIPKDG